MIPMPNDAAQEIGAKIFRWVLLLYDSERSMKEIARLMGRDNYLCALRAAHGLGFITDESYEKLQALIWPGSAENPRR